MNILVTGSEGNIGKRLVPFLKNKGYNVFRFDIKQGIGSGYLTGNICNVYELQKVFTEFRPDVVYHMAAMVSRVTCEVSQPYTSDVNLTGTENVISLCKQFNAKLIYFSTSEVYGNIGGELNESDQVAPNNFYGLTKHLGEKLVEYEIDKGLKAVTVRPFMFYDENEDMGDHRSAMIRFVEKLIQGKPIIVHRGAMRSWMHIEDGVRALERVMYVGNYEIINIGHPDVVPIEDLANMILKRLGLSDELIIYRDLPDKMTLTKFPNLDKQKNLLKIEPRITIEEGIDRVIDVVRKKIITD